MKKKILFLSLWMFGWLIAYAGSCLPRERVNINRGWYYQENDPAGVDSALHYTRLKPYLLPCANDLFVFGDKHKRPEGNRLIWTIAGGGNWTYPMIGL